MKKRIIVLILILLSTCVYSQEVKKDIINLKGLDAALNLRPVTFKKDTVPDIFYGFLKKDIKNITKTLDFDSNIIGFVAINNAAIQSLYSELQLVKTFNNSLEDRVDNQQIEINQLKSDILELKNLLNEK